MLTEDIDDILVAAGVHADVRRIVLKRIKADRAELERELGKAKMANVNYEGLFKMQKLLKRQP